MALGLSFWVPMLSDTGSAVPVHFRRSVTGDDKDFNGPLNPEATLGHYDVAHNHPEAGFCPISTRKPAST